MTLAAEPIRVLIRRIFHLDIEEKTRREKVIVNAVSEAAGTFVPWALAGALGWAMITLMTGWNVGLF